MQIRPYHVVSVEAIHSSISVMETTIQWRMRLRLDDDGTLSTILHCLACYTFQNCIVYDAPIE